MKITNIEKKMFILDTKENLKCQKYAKKEIYSCITTFQNRVIFCYLKKTGTSSLSHLIGNYVKFFGYLEQIRMQGFYLCWSLNSCNVQIAYWPPTLIKTIGFVPIVVFDAYCIHSRIDGQHASYKTRSEEIVSIAQISPYVPYNTFFIICT